ncbi:MAG: retroviral-like aspartic protease family protein [Bacteroidaceae bacterium]|nr:retroviral-like aspartic protease family protein [Bacteroidaceae bacterium]
MGTVTRKYQETVDSIVTESYVYAATDLVKGISVKRVKVQRSLWDTGASVSLISARVAKVLGLESIGKSGVSGYNEGVDVKDTYLIHIGLPTGDIVTNIMAMEFDSDEYDVVIGMDVICKGDLAITNQCEKTTFTFRIPSEKEIDFSR